MDNPPTMTTGTPSWRELLSTLGETFNGCTTQEVIDSEGRPEAAAWLTDDALTSMEGLTELLSSPWALHTPEQVGAVAAALTAVQHHAEQAKGQLLDVLEAMEERGDVKLSRFRDDPQEPLDLAPLLFRLWPSPSTADHVFAKFSAVPLLRPMPGTFAEALHQTAELLADLVVPDTAIEIFENPDHSHHQGYVQLQHEGEQWRLGFYASEEEWFLDDYPNTPPSLVSLGHTSLLASHPAKLAEATRARLAELTGQA